MKIHYFAVSTIAAVLSMGTVTSCSNPPPAPSSTETVTKPASAPNSTETVAKVKPSLAVVQAGSLATELQGKPVVVDIYASWCPACKNVAPTLEKLKKEYAGKANFVVLDVSDKAAIAKSTARAKELGLDKFLAKNQTQTGLIAVMDPATGKVLTEERDEPEIATYKKPLDAFIAKAK
jgi:thiol-disulfide isomerase/thioredoxin